MNTFEKIAHLAQAETLEKYANQWEAAAAGAIPLYGIAAAPGLADDGRGTSTLLGQLVGMGAGGLLAGGAGHLIGKKFGANRYKKMLRNTYSRLKRLKGSQWIDDIKDARENIEIAKKWRNMQLETGSGSGIVAGGALGASAGGGIGAYLGHGTDGIEKKSSTNKEDSSLAAPAVLGTGGALAGGAGGFLYGLPSRGNRAALVKFKSDVMKGRVGDFLGHLRSFPYMSRANLMEFNMLRRAKKQAAIMAGLGALTGIGTGFAVRD